MPTDPSRDASTLHRAELDELITDLVVAGFLPINGDRRNWIGPINDALARLTTATRMRVEVRNGWPYRHPYLFVDGLVGRRHVNPDGNVCLWTEDEDRYGDWLRLDAVQKRIEEWVADQENGAPDPPLDAHLYFAPRGDRIVTLDIEDLVARRLIRRADGAHGFALAELSRDVFSIRNRGTLKAAWFFRSGISAPPANESSLRNALTHDQRRAYDRFAAGVTRSQPGLGLLLWEEAGVTNALAVQLTRRSPGRCVATGLEVARTDRSMLLLRSGSDAPLLAGKTVAVFGVGAIGSEVAVLLARSGIGRLILIDDARLRPANMSRHAAAGRFIGTYKSEAVAQTIRDALPYVDVEDVHELLWRVDRVSLVLGRADLIVDATGNRAYRDFLSRLAVEGEVPMVAIALHRGGRISRASVQVAAASPLWGRTVASGFPEVPVAPGPPPPPTWETGCGAPVNDAPPIAVIKAAVTGAQVAIDVLTNRDRVDRDIVETYEPIEAPPFDQPGRLVFEPSR